MLASEPYLSSWSLVVICAVIAAGGIGITGSYHLVVPGRWSVKIFLTDLDGTVTQHDGNVLAVDGFPFFYGNVFGGRR